MNEQQLAALNESFHAGSEKASHALAKWIEKPAIIEIDAVVQLPLAEAVDLLQTGDDPVCFCVAELKGLLTGLMIFAFDDASGLALTCMLVEPAELESENWSEMQISAVLETTNILCCSYLNSLAERISRKNDVVELLPSSPVFNRDFAVSLMQSALMGQAVSGDTVILTRTRFQIDRTDVNWTLLFIPDAESMSRILDMLSDTTVDSEGS